MTMSIFWGLAKPGSARTSWGERFHFDVSTGLAGILFEILGKMVKVRVSENDVWREVNVATVLCELCVLTPPIPQMVVTCFERFNPSS